MNEYPVTFDGNDITRLFSVQWPIARTPLSWEPTSIDVPGRNGSVVGGTRALPVDVTMTLWTLAETRTERQQAVRTLAEWMAVDEPRPLYLGDEGGLWRMAMPVNASEMASYINADSVSLTFRCFDPVLYGAEHSITVPANGSVTVLVGGTAPTMPTVECASAREGSSGYWQVWLDEERHLDADTGAMSVPVVADCARRVLRVNDVVQMLQTGADWLSVTPGTHTFRVSGTGAAKITWTERWW